MIITLFAVLPNCEAASGLYRVPLLRVVLFSYFHSSPLFFSFPPQLSFSLALTSSTCEAVFRVPSVCLICCSQAVPFCFWLVTNFHCGRCPWSFLVVSNRNGKGSIKRKQGLAHTKEHLASNCISTQSDKPLWEWQAGKDRRQPGQMSGSARCHYYLRVKQFRLESSGEASGFAGISRRLNEPSGLQWLFHK